MKVNKAIDGRTPQVGDFVMSHPYNGGSTVIKVEGFSPNTGQPFGRCLAFNSMTLLNGISHLRAEFSIITNLQHRVTEN